MFRTSLLLLLSALVPAGVYFVRFKHQRYLDSDRVTFQISFPNELKPDKVKAWIRAISGNAHGASIVFETLSDAWGKKHIIRVPKRYSSYVVNQLRSLIPGSRAVPVEIDHPKWTAAIEVGMTNPSHTLNIGDPEAIATSLLSAMDEMSRGQAVLLQWVVTPAKYQPAPPKKPSKSTPHPLWPLVPSQGLDNIEDRREKLSEPNMVGILRIAAKAKNEKAANNLIFNVRASLSAVRSQHNALRLRRSWSRENLLDRVTNAHSVVMWPARLTSTELAGLTAWPLGSPHIPGLSRGQTRHLYAPENVARKGRVIAISNLPGSTRPIAMRPKEGFKHVHVVGPTGVGKTTLLSNMIAQDIQAGYGAVVLESKGDLFRDTLARIPAERKQDVIVLDVDDTERPIGINILSGNSRAVVDELSALISNIYNDTGVYAPMLIYHGLHALSETGGTFIDLPSIVSPQTAEEEAWREDIVSQLRNNQIKQWWQEHLSRPKTKQDQMAVPLHNRTWQLTTRAEIRAIFGQHQSSFTFEEVLRDNKILLINLNGVRVGEQTASIVGTLMMNGLWSAARSVKNKRPTYLYLDEFQDFLKLPVNAQDMLAKMRSFGVGMVLAHQHLGQLHRDMQQAVMSNARTKIVFQAGADDARTFAREFGRAVDDSDFMNLGKYEVIMRIATEDGVSTPITGVTQPPSAPVGLSDEIRELSRQTYGRPAEEVEAEINSRRAKKQKRKARTGKQKWS